MDHILLDHTSLIEKLYSGCCFLNDNRLAMWKPLRNARAIQQQRKLPLVMSQKATDGNGQPATPCMVYRLRYVYGKQTSMQLNVSAIGLLQISEMVHLRPRKRF